MKNKTKTPYRAYDKATGKMAEVYSIDWLQEEVVVRLEQENASYVRSTDDVILSKKTEQVDKDGNDIYFGDILAHEYQNDDYLLQLIKEHNVKPNKEGIYELPIEMDESLLTLVEYYDVVEKDGIPYAMSHKYQQLGRDEILTDGHIFKVVGNVYQDRQKFLLPKKAD